MTFGRLNITQKLSLTGPKIRQNNSASFLLFLVFQCLFRGFGGLNSQMANFDSRTYCNTFWIIFGTFQNVTKYGPSDFVFITEILQQLQENMETCYKHISFVNMDI